MTYRFPLLAAAGLLALIFGSALQAQQDDYQGFPAKRVRLQRPDNHVPDPLYPENRVVIRKVDLAAAGAGMQIRGQLFTDLDADSVPMGEQIPRGQLMDLVLKVELYHYETILQRDSNGQVNLPQIDPQDRGRVVPGQSAQVTILDEVSGFGHAAFELPAMEKPLAPGIYKLVATLNLQAQTPEIRNSIKWVSELFGSEIESVPQRNPAGNIIGFEDVYHNIMADEKLHDKWYDELMNRTRQLEDSAQVWIGAVKKGNRVSIVRPGRGSDSNPANFLLWTKHHEFADQVIKHQSELDEINDGWFEKELERFKQLDFKDIDAEKKAEIIARKEQALRTEEQRIRTDNPKLITMYGGATDNDEEDMVLQAKAAKSAVIKQIAEFQEFLIRRYWEFVDGTIRYGGWHQVNHPCYQIFAAIKSGDPLKAGIERIDKMRKIEEDPGMSAHEEQVREQWKFQPPEVQQEAISYLFDKLQSDKWDPENWVVEIEGQKGSYRLDQEKFGPWRLEFIQDFLTKSDAVLADLDTTQWYYNQIWPAILQNAKAARDDVISLTFSWEWYIRTELMKEPEENITESWKNLDDSQTLDLRQYYSRGDFAPGTVKGRFDSNVARIKRFMKLENFVPLYRRAVQNEVEPGAMPGFRPPTVPPKK